MGSRYQEVYERWSAEPEAFWREAGRDVAWIKAPDAIFDPASGVYGTWFPDATCNTCFNALDRHVEAGHGDQAALIHDSPLTDCIQRFTYKEVLEEVAVLGAVLTKLGIGIGDRVVIYMPMVPEAVFAMLACARIGAVHSVVFGGFAAHELAKRIDDARPKAVLTASCGLEPGRIVHYKPLLDAAIDLATAKPASVLLLQREQSRADMRAPRDRDWGQAVADARARGLSAPCVEVRASDPLYILYTSGTTGVPKGVVRDNGGHLVALNWTMRNVYGIEPGEVFWAASDIGWAVGHSYITYAPLFYGATALLYEGKPVGTPDPGAFWRVIAEHGVVSLFTAPTALRAIKKEDPSGSHLGRYDISSLRSLFLAGERADPDTVQWAEQMLGVPVIDHWWQTETGWPIAANPVGLGILPIKYGSPTVPMPGYDVRVVDEAHQPVEPNVMGSIIIGLPLPPGNLCTLWGQDQRMRESYLEAFPGFYSTSDAGFKDEDGYVYIMGRTDDIINVAGHRLSTGGMEEVVAGHAAVAECAVVGVKDAIKGEVPYGFIVLKAGVDRPAEEIEQEVVRLVRERIGPVAAFKTAITVPRLPKTRSGKILRRTMKAIVDEGRWTVPATIDDPVVLDEIAGLVRSRPDPS
ncbi:propionyl-CoA synthetase [Ancylobacter sp. VNQ12]|uniref:propionyl-CoA synthetase n=1 Tax=Ancylobacter sp. VNQ12 TaxID=3400920 RepID=UPI003C02B880